jgi:hypothetical protein
VFSYINPERALTKVSLPERKSERTPPGLLFQALQETLKAEVSCRTKALESGLSAPEILRATQMINELFDFLFFFVRHQALVVTRDAYP